MPKHTARGGEEITHENPCVPWRQMMVTIHLLLIQSQPCSHYTNLLYECVLPFNVCTRRQTHLCLTELAEGTFSAHITRSLTALPSYQSSVIEMESNHLSGCQGRCRSYASRFRALCAAVTPLDDTKASDASKAFRRTPQRYAAIPKSPGVGHLSDRGVPGSTHAAKTGPALSLLSLLFSRRNGTYPSANRSHRHLYLTSRARLRAFRSRRSGMMTGPSLCSANEKAEPTQRIPLLHYELYHKSMITSSIINSLFYYYLLLPTSVGSSNFQTNPPAVLQCG